VTWAILCMLLCMCRIPGIVALRFMGLNAEELVCLQKPKN
jgi:hypothetical protein